jgi:hypothetical protein
LIKLPPYALEKIEIHMIRFKQGNTNHPSTLTDLTYLFLYSLILH